MNNNLKSIEKLIGNTPLVCIEYKFKNQTRHMFAKLEWFNLTGSIKDRSAFEIIKDAYKTGKLKENQPICEVTSGNMGISLCAIAKITHNPIIICIPKNMSIERIKLLKSFGAKVELLDNFPQCFEKANEYEKQGAYLCKQFENKSNIKAQTKTAKEIAKKLDNIPTFVSGVGTGGTLIGIGKYLKKKYNAKIIAIDPKEAKLLKCGKSQGKHKIQGLSDEIIPKLYDKTIIDEIIEIASDDAICMARKLCKELGLNVGISSGANFLGCVLSNQEFCTTVFADDNKKYLSTDLTNDEIKSDLVDNIELIKYSIV